MSSGATGGVETGKRSCKFGFRHGRKSSGQYDILVTISGQSMPRVATSSLLMHHLTN